MLAKIKPAWKITKDEESSTPKGETTPTSNQSSNKTKDKSKLGQIVAKLCDQQKLELPYL